MAAMPLWEEGLLLTSWSLGTAEPLGIGNPEP